MPGAFLFCREGFFKPVWPAEAGRADLPVGLAVWALIQSLRTLQTMATAFRTGAAFVEPVTVSVQAVLDMIRQDLNFVLCCNCLRFLPGLDFFTQEVDVAGIADVAAKRMPKLMQERYLTTEVIGVGDGVTLG